MSWLVEGLYVHEVGSFLTKLGFLQTFLLVGEEFRLVNAGLSERIELFVNWFCNGSTSHCNMFIKIAETTCSTLNEHPPR